MRLTGADGEMGITVYSRYPENTASLYRLANPSGGDFELTAQGTAITGALETGVTPQVDTWYHFRLQVRSEASETTLRARVWAEGDSEPGTWQVEAGDDTGTRLTSGAAGVFADEAGSQSFDDLLVTPLTQYTTTSRVISYTYDSLYRLTEADYSTGEAYTYTYDAAGNRLSQVTLAGTTVYTYDDANRLVNVGGQAYTWDDNGNLLDDGDFLYTWDSANRLVTVSQKIVVGWPKYTEYGYNGLGERTHKWRTTLNTTTETQYTLDVAGGLPQVIVETSEGQTSRYLTGLAQQQDNFWAYQHADGLGSVRHLSDASAEVTLLQSYDPFGNLAEQSGPGASGFGYTGEQEDANYGLVFLRARYYDPSTGRFVNRDPWMGNVMRPDTLQGYSYGRNNPILYTDPSGRDYVVNVDRYTCDDSHARGGYVQHVDKATGTWGFWPCIVNPANLPINATLQITPEGHLQYPVPARAAQQTPYQSMPPVPEAKPAPGPVYPPFSCNSLPLGPSVYRLDPLVKIDIVVFHGQYSDYEDSIVSSLRIKNETVARYAGVSGIVVDAIEAISAYPAPGVADAFATIDILPAIIGSISLGETYLGKPHQDLPEMLVLGQDFVVASAEAAIGGIGKYAAAIAGTATGQPGIVMVSPGVDVATSLSQAVYDAGRTFGGWPTIMSTGLYPEQHFPWSLRAAFMFYRK